MAGLPEPIFDDHDDFDDFDDLFDINVDDLEDQPLDEDSAMPAESIQKSSDARRRLEEYWEQKSLKENLKDIDDWDDE